MLSLHLAMLMAGAQDASAMSLESMVAIARWSFLYIGLVFPGLAFQVLRGRFRKQSAGTSSLVVVIATWFLLFLFWGKNSDLQAAYYESLRRPDDFPTYDGHGAFGAVLLLGWLPPLLSIWASKSVAVIIRKLRKTRPST